MNNTTTKPGAASIEDRARGAIQKSQKDGTLAGMNSAQVHDVLSKYTLAIQNSLPSGGNPNRIVQMAVFQIMTNPALAACTTQSVIGCVLNSALLGMNPALKQCWFIPYQNQKTGKTDAQFQLSYTGLLTLARRSGTIRDVYAHVVRKGDTFRVQYGTDRKIEHIPAPDGDSTRELTHAYAVIHYHAGGCDFVVFDKNEVEKRRQKSRGQNNTPTGVWAEWDADMWKKTVLKNLLKTAPLSDEQAAAMQTDGVAITPDAIKAGEYQSEMIAYAEDGEVTMVEAPDLADIRAAVAELPDMDNLDRYFRQNPEWAGRADVIEIFSQRKAELKG